MTENKFCSVCGRELEPHEIQIFGGYSIEDPTFPRRMVGGQIFCIKCLNDYEEEIIRLNKPLQSEEKEETKNNSQKATEKQKSFLKSLGFAGSTDKLTKIEAHNLIRKLINKR